MPRLRQTRASPDPEPARQAMNILGVGNLELLWILLLALVLLGPGRLVDAARAAGKFWREAQHTIRSVADAASIDLDAPPPKIVPREPLPSPDNAVSRGDAGAADGERETDADDDAARGDADPAAEREPDTDDDVARGETDGDRAERREAP